MLPLVFFIVVAIVAIVTIVTIVTIELQAGLWPWRSHGMGDRAGWIQRRAMPPGTALLCVVASCYFISWPWRKVLAMMGVV